MLIHPCSLSPVEASPSRWMLKAHTIPFAGVLLGLPLRAHVFAFGIGVRPWPVRPCARAQINKNTTPEKNQIPGILMLLTSDHSQYFYHKIRSQYEYCIIWGYSFDVLTSCAQTDIIKFDRSVQDNIINNFSGHTPSLSLNKIRICTSAKKMTSPLLYFPPNY